MVEIKEFPFSPPMAEAALTAKKICTSRNKKYGEIGDTFRIHGDLFRIVDIQNRKLSFIATNFYRLEGFEQPGDFVQIWQQLHNGTFDSAKVVYVHFFTRID